MRIGNFRIFKENIGKSVLKTAIKQSVAPFFSYLLELGKLLVVCLVMFQMFTQPMQVLAQSRPVLEAVRTQMPQRSKVKPQIDEDYEGFLPEMAKRTRRAVFNAFGVNIPLPQVFGGNGKLHSLFAGNDQTADKNKELIESALKDSEGASKKEKMPTETVISLNAPVLNAGTIEGSLRVSKEATFNLNNDFRITENLYAAGAPDISTQNDSTLQEVINDDRDELSETYAVILNGGKIDGNVYIHSFTGNNFSEIPLALPKPAGSEKIEINSANDLKNIKDWKNVRSLTVNAENLEIQIPPGNYENITLNAPNKLKFSEGNYNFSDTINFQKGSSLKIGGKTALGISKNLLLEDVSIIADQNIQTEDFKLNILGSTVTLNGKSEINGFVRAPYANVILNDKTKISGHLIAGSLVMNGGIVTKFAPNSRALFFANDDNIAVVNDGITLNGRIEGSIQQRTGQTTILNSGAVITGDLLAPGIPSVVQNGSPNFGGTVTGTGSSTPTGYQVILNSNTTLRKLKNRINPPPMPTVPTPTATSGTVSVVINNSSQYPTNFSNVRDITMNSNAGLMTLPPGNYRNLSINSGSGFKLGTAGQTTPVTYNVSSLTVNSNSQIQILSPVILNLGLGLNLNASVGVLQNPEWLKVNVSSGSVNLNSNSSLYGALIAPASTVTVNTGSFLIGNVVCKKLAVNTGGIVRNVLPNLLSDTNISITSPVNNTTTTATSIAVSGTAQSSAGVANVFVNNQAATFNASNNTWTIANVPLVLGNNIITARVVDNSGTEVSTQIVVVRQSPIVDGEPPSVSISTPANNSVTQAQTITVSGVAADLGTNPSGVASVSVNGTNAVLGQGGNWTVSGISLNLGANAITATATDNAGNHSSASITVTRQAPDTAAPILAIVSPANNSETTNATTSVSGTVVDEGTNPSGVASVTVNGQTATINGSSWTIDNISLTVGANTIIANAIDNAGNSTSRQITIPRKEPDTTAPEVVITSPLDNFETNNASISISGTANDLGANASGVESVTVHGQNANYSSGNWTLPNVALNIGANTINVKARDIAGNEATATVTVTRREPDTQAPTLSITSPANNFQTTDETLTIQGNVSDDGANSSGLQSVTVNGVNATISGNTWTASNIPLNVGSNTISVSARDNNNNTSSGSITVIRNPLDTQAPAISIVSPTNNFETFDSQIVVSGTANDGGDGATGVQSVAVNGVSANYNAANNTWSATVSLVDGVNQIVVTAIDNAPTPNQAQASINVTKVAILPPTLTITNPNNGAFLSTNSVTVAGNFSSNKPDMTFSVTVNGEAANLAGREFTKTLNLTDGTNVITVSVTDALGQQAQQSIMVTNDRTPPSVVLTNVPQVVNPGESYGIGATAADAFGISEVEFTVDGTSVLRSAVSPYQFTLNIPANQAPNQTINISAIARDNAGLSATATARVVTNGPSGLTGYVFDDATGYVLPLVSARLNNQTSVSTDENGLFSFIATTATGNIVLSKQGYTSIERTYSASAGSGVEIFDARLTPLDSKANLADQNGALTASDSNNKIQVQFAPNSFPNETDVRITPVSPQGLANLLPYGWSPIPDAVVDIRANSEEGFSNRNFANQSTLSIPQVSGLASDIPVVLARYNSATHNWIAVQTNIFAGAGGSLSANISASGQYAFLVADTGATAPPAALSGENLPASAPANSEQLDSATATAFSSPSVALYSANAKARISFIANSASKLPSGVSIEASFNDSYLTLVDRTFIAVDRPSQDFVLYAFPSVSTNEPNKLGAYFVAKPIRTDFGVTDLLNAKVHVDVRSGRLSQTGILIGQTGGIVRGAEGSELEIPSGSTNNSQIIFFNKIPSNQSGVILPENYEILGAFEVNINGNPLTQTAKISMPSDLGDDSKIVAAKVVSIGGQQGLKVIARVVENNSRLETSISQPAVPVGVNLNGIKDSGKYVFVRLPNAFGYIKGTISSALPNTNAIKITNTQTPFVDVAANNGNYTVLGLANAENVQVDAISLNNDATGFNTASISSQDAVVNLPINLASAVLSVQTVTPTNGAANVVVTTPVTISFNKPILASTVTGSNIKLVTASGNPVISTLTTLAGGRTVTITPSANLQSSTNYKVQVSTNIKDIYGNSLANAFESTFRTAEPIAPANQLQPAQIRISYPNEAGFSTISIPAGSVPSGSTIIAINNSTGATVSTVAGTSAIELLIQVRVGDEIELIIRQPDGTEYRVKQAAYRRADGFVSVSSNGGTITSEDGTLVLQVPAGAIIGQANVRMRFAPESEIPIAREGEMAPSEMPYLGGIKIEAQGNFTNTQELHLEIPAPADAPEGQRALVMKTARINHNGQEIDAWETVTSAKIEGGKIKTTSPPFIGITLAGLIVGLTLLSFWVFLPVRQRVVMGVARKRQSDGTTQPAAGAICSIPTPNSEQPRIYATSQPFTGKFALSHNNQIFTNTDNVQVLCAQSGVAAYALAYPYTATQSDFGIFGFNSRYATVVFDADSPVNLPPQISVEARTVGLGEGEIDTLRETGKVIVGSSINVKVAVTPLVESFTGNLFINGSIASQLVWTQSQNGNTKYYETVINTSVPGSYGIAVKAQTVATLPNTANTATYNFIALADPNNCSSNSNAPPVVLTESSLPRQGAKQIDVGTKIHLEFSEPIKGFQSVENIYLTEIETGQVIGGTISSGGLPIGANTLKCQIDFTPARRLKGGKEYRFTLKTSVKDTDDTPLIEEFSRTFTTFQGSVITPEPIPDNSYRIATLDNYIITAEITGTVNANGLLKIYDFSSIFGNNPGFEYKTPISSTLIANRPLAITAFSASFPELGPGERNFVAVTTTAVPDTTRPNNLWLYDITIPTSPVLVAVVSLSIPEMQTEIPVSVTVHDKRAYIGNVSFGGVMVVDIEEAIRLFEQEIANLGGNNPENRALAINRIRVRAVFPQGGFGQEARIQRGVYSAGAGQPSPVKGVSVITQNTGQTVSPIAYLLSTYLPKLISFDFNNRSDGLLNFSDTDGDGRDDRWLLSKNLVPESYLQDLQAVSRLQLFGSTKDLVVAVSQSSLYIFDVTDPRPRTEPENPRQYPAKSFVSLGLAETDLAIKVEVEGTLAYVLFPDKVAVIDFSDPENPYLSTTITGIGGGLRWMAVKDGLVYTIGQNGVHVSIGRGLVQMVAYGIDPHDPTKVCGNPVVIKSDTNEMAQPAGFYFQVFGHDRPLSSKIIIREVTLENNSRIESVLETIRNIEVFQTVGQNITAGRAQMNPRTIDPSKIYTAEIILDEGTGSELRSKQIEIPFSQLITNFPSKIAVNKTAAFGQENQTRAERIGGMSYALAGAVENVTFQINGTAHALYEGIRPPSEPVIKQPTRPLGRITDFLKLPISLPLGRYTFRYSATLKANSAVTEVREGELIVGDEPKDLRQPGSMVVNGVEVTKGNLAISENDLQIKGRGLSLEFNRSYNSQSADSFGSLGYGWRHNYQITLLQTGGDSPENPKIYYVFGGEGGVQKFEEANLKFGIIPASAPNLGYLRKNADGSFDCFTKSYVRYSFRSALTENTLNKYIGNAAFIEEPNGNRISFEYDTFGRLRFVKDSSNRKLTLDYELATNDFAEFQVEEPVTPECPSYREFLRIINRIGESQLAKKWRITRVFDETGLAVDYGYDEVGNLQTVTRNADDEINGITRNRVSEYRYNPLNNNRATHLLKSVQSPNNLFTGAKTAYSYEMTSSGVPMVSAITMPEGVNNSFVYQFDSDGKITQTTFTDGNSNQTIYTVTDGRYVTGINAPNSAITTLEWTNFGQISRTVDPEGKITSIGYDLDNNPISQTVSGFGKTISTITTFDKKFTKMTSFTDGNNQTTRYSVNQSNGNIDDITLPTGRKIYFNYFANGDLKDTTDQYGTVTQFSNYDAYGNPQTIVKQLGNGETQTISQLFDARSRQRSVNDSLGVNVVTDYDNLDRPARQITSDPAGFRDTLTTKTSYLPEGQPQRQTRTGTGQSYSILNEYDNLQRLKKTTETVSGYGDVVRNYTYDKNSNLLTEQNRRGILTERTYNDLNHLIKIVQGGRKIWDASGFGDVDKVGNPREVIDLYGNQTVYVYDGLQRLIEKRLPESVTEILEYDNNNNITASIDRNNNRTEYGYDPLNRVQTVKDALGRITKWTYIDGEHKTVKENIARKLTETTVLDGLERPVLQRVSFGSTVYDTVSVYSGRNLSVTDPRNTVTNYQLSGYGETGRTEVAGAVPEYRTEMRYSAFGAVKQMTDALNRVTTISNDGFNRQREISFNGEFSESRNYDGEGLLTEFTDRRGVSSTYGYDELGRKTDINIRRLSPETGFITTQISYDDVNSKETRTDANFNPTVLEYDGLRRVKQITNAENKVKTLIYDGENLREEGDFFNSAERRTKYIYDKLNRVREIYDRKNGHTVIDYSNDDLTKTVTDRRGNITTEISDALGRVTAVNSYGKVASFTYDGKNNRLTAQDGLNNQTAFTYDKLNRLTNVVHPNNLQTETYSYDAAGNLKTHSDGRGGVTEILEYDALDQAKKVKDGAGNITEFVYDGGGLLLSKKDPKLNLTNYRYNALGSMTQVTDADLKSWTFNYDDAQNLISTNDPLNRLTAYEYDALNRLKKTTQPLGRVTSYNYDNNSNVTSITDPKGQQTAMTYNVLDDVETVNYNNQISHTFGYDAEQNLRTVAENRNGQTRNYSREYDERNRLTRTTDALNKTVAFTFDAANNLKTLTDAANTVTTYNYDAKNQVDTVVQNGIQIADYDWYADGLLQKVAYQNQTSRNYVYDNADRVSGITNNFANNQSEGFEYAYDANSNRISEVKKANGTAFRTIAYEYDKLDRLTNADYTTNVQTPNPPINAQAVYVENTQMETFVYDAVGNRTSEKNKTQSKTITLVTNESGQTTHTEETAFSPEQTTTATFNALNELTQLDEPNNVSTFEYDANGNLTKLRKNASLIAEYEYDVRNQLTKVSNAQNQTLASFDYDFERKRLSKIGANGYQSHVYAGNQVVNEFNAFGTQTAKYTIGAGEVVRSEFGNTENNYHFTDALGSVTSLAKLSDGSLTSRNEYNAFGEISTNGNSANSIGYTGQRLDNETGLMALGNGERYYSPSYARFIQQDSFLGLPNVPQSLNRFSYVHNNPFGFTDPTGNAPQDLNKSDSWHFWNDLSNSDSALGKAAGFIGLGFYEVGDTLTFGGVSRQDRTMTEYSRGEISGKEALWRTTANVAVSAPLLAAGLMTGGASVYVQMGIGAVAAGVQRFGTDNYEMSFEGRKEFSSLGTYATDIVLGGLFTGAGAIAGKLGSAMSKAVASEIGAYGKGFQGFIKGVANQAKLEAKSLSRVAREVIEGENALFKGEVNNLKNSFNKLLNDETGALTLGKPKYETIPNQFPGEEHGNFFGGSKVKYLNDAERAELELFVKDGKLVDVKGNLYDTTGASSLHTPNGGKAIFVMDEAGKIFANTYQKYGKFHHSSLVAGKPVASAGELTVKNGQIIEISKKSGHYRPDEIINKQIIKELESRGMDTSKIKETDGF